MREKTYSKERGYSYVDYPRILWIYYEWGSHPVFVPLATALGADRFAIREPNEKSLYRKIPVLNHLIDYVRWLYLAFKLPKDYDAFLIDTGLGYQAAAVAKKLHLLKNTKIIVWCAWAGFSREFAKKTSKFFITNKLLKEVDIFLSPSKYRETKINEVVKDKKIIIVYGFPNPRIKPFLEENNVSPELNLHRLLTIPGNLTSRSHIETKGVDLVLEAFQSVKQKYADATLSIVGYGLSDKGLLNLIKTNGVTFIEHPNDSSLANLIKRSSLYVHIGRDDAFPTSALDAMYGGLPVLVSDQTGTIDVMEELDPRLVTSLHPKKIAEKIDWYFSLSEDERKTLSSRAKGISLKFDEGLIAKKFKEDIIGTLTGGQAK